MMHQSNGLRLVIMALPPFLLAIGAACSAGGQSEPIPDYFWKFNDEFDHCCGIDHVAFATRSTVVLASSEWNQTQKGRLILFDLKTGKERWNRRATPLAVSGFAVSPDRKIVATADHLGKLKTWDVATGRLLARLDPGVERLTGADLGRVYHLAFSPDGKLLASAGDAETKLWNTRAGRLYGILPRREEAKGIGFPRYHVSFSPCCKLLLLTLDNKAVVIDVITRKERARLNGGMDEHTLGICSPDGRLLLAGDGHSEWNGKVKLWWLTTSAESLTLQNVSNLSSASFTPDSRLIIGSCAEAPLRLWDVATGRIVISLPCHGAVKGDGVRAVACSPDGNWLASGGGNFLNIWSFPRLVEKGLENHSLDQLWTALSGDDLARAWGSTRMLAKTPERTVPFLKERVRPAPPADPARTRQLIADLNSRHFAIRQKATEELGKLGEVAAPALRQALAGKPTLDFRQRCERLLAAAEGPLQGDRLRYYRAVAALEYMGTPEARRLLTELAKGEPTARLTQEAKAALRRLKR